MGHARRASGLVVAALALVGCGSGSDYANNPRPPAPINVSAAITRDKVTVSPRDFGAGPITVTIANETKQAHRLTIASDELGASSPGIKQSTGPINPGGTATLKVDVREGGYEVSVDEGGIKPARLTVSSERPSAQNQLLQP